MPTFGYRDFDDFLQTRHIEMNPTILDDNLPDSYSEWLEDLGVDGLIELGDEYARTIKARYARCDDGK